MARKKGTFTSRTKARKRAADVVFEANQRRMDRSPQALRELLAERQLVTTAETELPAYAVEIVEGVADNLGRLDQLISRRAKVPSLDRLPGVDLAIMRVAVWEMIANAEDVDPIVAISEAVAIAKSISTDRSPAFVNAVLDAVRADIRDEPDGGNNSDDQVEFPAAVVPSGGAQLKYSELESESEDYLDELLGEY